MTLMCQCRFIKCDKYVYWSFKWGKGNILLKLKQTGCLSCNLSEEISCNFKKCDQHATLAGMLIVGGPCMCGAEGYGNSLYSVLSFALTPKLL